MNKTESRIVESLATLGIAAMPAEHSFGTSAELWSRLDDGSELFVSAYPVGTDESDMSLLDHREIEGVTVERVRLGSGSLRDRFQCGNLRFSTGGAVPPGYDDFDGFLAQFIIELDCSQGF